jgi:hypothetical protein
MKIHILNKFQHNSYKGIEIDTTSNSGLFRWLSPFLLPAPPAKNLENLWQFSKVYKKHIMPIDGYPDASWYKWRDVGYANPKAVRYPMGKGAIPEFTYWNDSKLGYIDARKQLYATEYTKNVVKTDSFKRLYELFTNGTEISLRDYDGYDYQPLGMSLKEVINNPNRKMGHAFVLAMILEGELFKLVS